MSESPYSNETELCESPSAEGNSVSDTLRHRSQRQHRRRNSDYLLEPVLFHDCRVVMVETKRMEDEGAVWPLYGGPVKIT